MDFRPDPPSQHEVLGSAQRYRDAQNEFRAQADVLRQIAGQIGHSSVWAGVSAEHVSSTLGTIANATDGFASASGSVASTLEVLAYAVSPLIAQRQSVIAQLKQQAREPGLAATLVFSKLKSDLISLESRIQRCFEQASDDVRAAATHAAAWRTDINVNPQAMRQAIGEEIGKSFASFAGGVVEGVWEPVAGTWNLVTHPESVVNLVRAFQADSPGTLKKMWDGIIDADTWQKDPARAMGKIAPGIIATILTAGEGGAALAAGRTTGKIEKAASEGGKMTAKTAGRQLDTIHLSSGESGSWNRILNNPKPDTTYIVDKKFSYTTDSIGRVSESSARLDTLIAKDRNIYQQRLAGGVDRLPGDDGGHIYGTQFGGPGESINITAMRSDLNRLGNRDYYALEQQWAKFIGEGKSIDVDIKMNYSSDSSLRPSIYTVTYKVDNGPVMSRIFKN
ncbi:DNA/RNA non-specific endonuclease [Arthrobacter sp. NPDC080031]|uniref:DNA/RNA non-specific endonuclease n=1 Tax=Arthrobacter sp. NPDC080031 TaxID=3155918 RepID=UPI00344ED097